MNQTQTLSSLHKKSKAIRASFTARMLFFVLADVLLLLLLATFPFIWNVFIEQDSMNQFLNTKGQLTDIDQIPDDTIVGVYWLFAKSIFISIGYILGLFALFVFGHTVAWNLHRKKKSLFQHWKPTLLSSIAWIFVALFPLFIILMIMALISQAFTAGGIGNVVLSIMMFIAWLLILFISHLTVVLLATATKGEKVSSCFVAVWEKGIVKFYTYLGWYVFGIILLILLTTLIGTFILPNNILFLSVLLVFFYLGWMKSYVTHRLG